MERFWLQEAAQWCKGELVGTNQELAGMTTDSRAVGEACLFLPIVGERYDAHDFIAQAVENGAAAVISARREEQYAVPTIYVQDTGQALLDLAHGYRQTLQARIVAVTGSVGKTTTKEMIASVLSKHCKTSKTQGNLNNEIGMPQSLLSIEQTTQAAVLEMGMNHFGELSRMTAAAQPDIAVITNIGTSHIAFLGSREGICKAKLEILEGLRPNGVAVLCGDEPLLWAQRGKLPCKTIYYGIENPECDFIARDIVNEGEIVRFSIVNRTQAECRQVPMGECIRAHLCVAGRHNVSNALAAAAVALQFQEEPGDIVAGLGAYAPSGFRQNTFIKNGYTILADCYNASPDSMEAALQAFSELKTAGRRIAVLGGMLELGDYAPEGHRRAGRAAAKYTDALFLYGAGSADMQQGALEGGMEAAQIRTFDTHAALAQALRQNAQTGDALLFKGSRGMQMEQAMTLFTGDT